ncbi:unnamed protein product [Moneuplotes crassus]|uniref:Uncharacterized protein n=2 Tax=Euplotes crassus TaxID=5936 RepID=A0AAD1U137_EUPCR|nr:unnamed protein product [Moneuplotes crassus]
MDTNEGIPKRRATNERDDQDDPNASANKVKDKRISNEIKILNASKFRNTFTFDEQRRLFTFAFDMKIVDKFGTDLENSEFPNGYQFKVFIDLTNQFPFNHPQIKFSCDLNHLVFDVNKLNFQEIMQENWHPSLRVLDVAERAERFILPMISTRFSKQADYCPINQLFTTVKSSILAKVVIIFSAVFIRLISNLLYYDRTFLSHFNTIIHTQKHPVEDWYSEDGHHEFQNYPPLYGYLYCLIGLIQSYLMDTNHSEITDSSHEISPSESVHFKLHNYICILMLTLFEALTLYSGVYMCVKSFYRKLNDRVKHSIILIILLCPAYLIANVLAVRFNSIMIGLMIWSLYFCINSIPTLCVLCATLGIHIEPKAFIFVIPMMIYTMKNQILNNPMFAMDWQRDIPLLMQRLTEKSFQVFTTYTSLFISCGFIWLPWIIHEDLGLMLEVIRNSFFPRFWESPQGFVGLFLFIYCFGQNVQSILAKSSDSRMLLIIFNLATAYAVFIDMNADSISVVITTAFLAFYELKEVMLCIIITSLYSIYPDVKRFDCYGLYIFSSLVYVILVKIKISHLDLTNNQIEPDVLLVPKNTDANIDDDLCKYRDYGCNHKLVLPIVTDNSDHPILGAFVRHSTIVEILLAISLCGAIAIEMGTGNTFLHGYIMRILLLFWLLLSIIILKEDLKGNKKEAFKIQPKDKSN